MTFWRSRQGGGILLIVLATLAFALLDAATKHATQLAPVLMLLWFRYLFQAVATFALRFPVQKRRLFDTPNPRFQALRGGLLLATMGDSMTMAVNSPTGRYCRPKNEQKLVASSKPPRSA